MKIIVARLFIWFLAILWVVPIIGLFMTSVRPYEEVSSGWWNFKNPTFTLHKYWEALTFAYSPLWRGILNSILITVFSTVLPISASFPAAYVISRLRGWYSEMLLSTFLIFLVIPAIAIIIPLYQMFNNLGLLDTRLAVILAMSARAVPWIMLFFRNFFTKMPQIYEEAARIDGANYWQLLRFVVIPLARPAIISIAVLQFIGAWNTFIFAFVFLDDPPKFTVVQQVPILKGTIHLDYSLLSAGSVLAMSIPLILFLALNKYYIRGLVGGAVKG